MRRCAIRRCGSSSPAHPKVEETVSLQLSHTRTSLGRAHLLFCGHRATSTQTQLRDQVCWSNAYEEPQNCAIYGVPSYDIGTYLPRLCRRANRFIFTSTETRDGISISHRMAHAFATQLRATSRSDWRRRSSTFSIEEALRLHAGMTRAGEKEKAIIAKNVNKVILLGNVVEVRLSANAG